jgi:hypothetical protein
LRDIGQVVGAAFGSGPGAIDERSSASQIAPLDQNESQVKPRQARACVRAMAIHVAPKLGLEPRAIGVGADQPAPMQLSELTLRRLG